MDLQALGNIGEFVGAIGVIASLLYLAIQVRQAQRVARAENVREVQAGFGRLFTMLAQDPELARIYRTGCEAPGQLDRIERQRFEHLLGSLFLHFIEAHEAHQHGLMPTDLYEPWKYGVASTFQTPGGTEWWMAIRGYLKPDAVQALDRLRDKVDLPIEFREHAGAPESEPAAS